MKWVAADQDKCVTSLLSEQELIHALQSKHVRGLEQLYDSYSALMYGLALRILNDSQEAEDLVQDVILSLWNNFTYNPSRGSLKTFVALLVRSRQSKQQALERLGSVQAPIPSDSVPMSAAVSDEIAQRVQQALADLPDNQRQALELAYYGGLSQSEIAQKLSVPVGTVKSWVRLSFSKLKLSLRGLV